MNVIPLLAVENQEFSVVLNGQNCDISIYQKSTGLYFDITLNGTLIESTILCLNAVPLVQYSYLGFNGNLVFIDTQGSNDPTYDGLGNRYILVYYANGEL